MSIATDEAFEWHGLHGDENGDRDGSYSADEMDDAYIAGRTAEPTKAEVEEVAKALYTSKAWNRLDERTPCWEDQSTEVRGNYMMNAGSLLKVARKAVTE